MVDTSRTFSPLEYEAIRIGMRDGESALSRSRLLGVLRLFTGFSARPLADKALETLRAYAELARVLRPRGRTVPTAILASAGFSGRQIAELARIIGQPRVGA